MTKQTKFSGRLNLRNFPEELYRFYQERGKLNRRTPPQEMIFTLEAVKADILRFPAAADYHAIPPTAAKMAGIIVEHQAEVDELPDAPEYHGEGHA